MYNIGIQHQLKGSIVADVTFMGNNSSHLSIINNLNDATPVAPSDSSSPQSRRRISSLLGDLPCYCPQGFSNYNALTLNLEKRFSKGLSVLANYTWSRALGVAPPLYWGINGAPIQNPLDLKREYGPLEFDVINRAAFSYTYELPFGANSQNKLVQRLIGGWQISGITVLQGGFPITPVLGTSLGKTFTNSRPNAIGDPTASSRRPDDWLNKAAFAVPSAAEVAAGNYFGNAGRGSVRAPRLSNFDFSLSKNVSLWENIRLQFRTEAYNLSNTPFFGGNGFINTNFNSPSFGKATQAGDPRVLQFGLKLIF